jgi:uncharacterized membrane protein YcaP (DUF421 family)
MTWSKLLFGGARLPFWTFSVRAVVLYLALIAATRWMGHRQVGILSGHNYLVAAGIVSLAALRMVNSESSMVAALAIVGVYAGINVLLSRLDLRWPLLIDREPISLIAGGRMVPENLRRARVTVDELLALLRLGGCPRLSDVWWAVLEPSGKLGIVKKSAASPVTRRDLAMGPVLVGISNPVIREGRLTEEAARQMDGDEDWLWRALKQSGVTKLDEVFLAAVDPDGSMTVVREGPEMGRQP